MQTSMMKCIKGTMIRCVRCKGRKKMFKMNGCYSHTNTGGVQVDCPMCLGIGSTKSLADAIEDAKKKNIKNKSDKTRDCDNAEKRENTAYVQE